MIKVFKHIGLLIGMVLLFSLIIPLLPVGFITMQVNATVGYTSVNITGSIYYWRNDGFVEEFSVISGETACASVGSPSGFAGFLSYHPASKYISIDRMIVKFDMSPVPIGVTPVSMKIWANQNHIVGSSTTHWLDDYFSWYKCLMVGSVPTVGEWGWPKNHPQLLSMPLRWTNYSLVGGLYEYPIYSGWVNQIWTDKSSANLTWLSFCSLEDILGSPGTWTGDAMHLLGTSIVKLEVFYTTPAVDRTMNILINDADYGGVITGTENITGISWLTPRAAFSDEQIGFRIDGNPGAAFTWEIFDSSGQILDSGNNTIKINNYYYKYYQPEVNYTDWVKMRVRQINTGELYQSYWGRIEPPPDTSQRLLTVSAVDSEYPQYDYEFSKYVIYKNGVGYLFWKTNLEAGDMANYHIKLMSGGDQVNATMFTANMSTLNTDYFRTMDTENYDMAHWRYLMFTPISTGLNTYDGMIIDIGKDYTLNNCGFWQGSIRKNSDNSTLTWTDSADFYLNSIDQGVSMTVVDTLAGDGLLNVAINIGNHSKVPSRLANVTIQVIDAAGTVYGSSSGHVYAGANDISFPQPTIAGAYQARVTFYDSTLVPDYTYIHDIQFTLAAGTGGTIPPGEVPGTTGFFAWLNALLDSKGMNNAAGHWVIIILLTVLVAAVFGVYGKMPLVATVIDILIFGLAIYIKWIDTWIIALLAIAAGFTVYRLFKKNTGEQKEV